MDEPEEGYRLPVKFRYGDDYRKYFSVGALLLVSTQKQTENWRLYFKFKFSFVYKFLNIIIIMNK